MNRIDIEIEILGSGGAVATPKAFCSCRICVEAIEKGPPFSRCGPSYFIHGPNILIDTPEEIRLQLTRSKIHAIEGCFYSHWHPDHVAGRRVFEANLDFVGGFLNNKCTAVYLPAGVAKDFRSIPGLGESFDYLEKRGVILLVELQEGQSVEFPTCRVTPIQLAAPGMYAFLIEAKSSNKRALIAPDEVYGWNPPPHVQEVDLAILQNGLFEFEPFSGKRRLPEGHLEEIHEMNFEYVLQLIEKIRAKQTILSHLEEPEDMSFLDYKKLEQLLSPRKLNVSFAYDMQRITL
jgi:phosphoribosyl 1,2-cyclic phosphate phosphodiesterase